MDHHYLPYRPRRVKREMKKRLIVFYACQLNAYLTHLDKRKEMSERKSMIIDVLLLLFVDETPSSSTVRTDVFDLSKLLVTHLN